MKKQNVFKILTKMVLSVFLVFSSLVIINAIEKSDFETEEVYIVREAEELRDEYSTTYENSDGTYTSFLYASPIRYRNDEGQLIDIDESITRTNESERQRMSIPYEYRATSTEIDILLPETVDLETQILLRLGEYAVKLSPISAESARRAEINSDERASEVLESATKSNGRLINEFVTDNYGKTENKNTNIKYDAFSEKKTRDGKTNLIELEYLPQNDGIKENIILNERLDTNRFDFWLELEGLEAVETDYGAIVLVDKVTKEEKGLIPIPLICCCCRLCSNKWLWGIYTLWKSTST